VAENYIRIVQDMYRNSTTQVHCTSGHTDPFSVKVWLHQESALSRFLFAIVMDCTTESVIWKAPWDIMFADDVDSSTEERKEAKTTLRSGK